MTDALLHRINPRHELNDAARQYGGLTLREICRVGLEAAGVDVRGLDVRAMAGIALGMQQRGGYNSISDLPVVFGNVINRTLRDAYRVVQHHLEEFVRQFKWALTSRQVFKWLQETVPETLTDIQRVARFYYLQHNCFGGKVEGQRSELRRRLHPV